MAFLKLVNRQILRELFILFLLCLGIFLTLLLIGKMLKLREVLFSLDLSGFDLLSLFVYLSPFFLLLLIPIACMISMFLTFQRMSADRELMTLRAGGISLAQISPAPIFFLILCALINLIISFYGLSWGMQNFQDKLLKLAKNKAQLSIQAGVFNEDFPNLTIYAQNVDREKGALYKVFVQDASSSQSSNFYIVAPKGEVVTDYERGRILFALSNGCIYNQNKEKLNILRFANYRLVLNMNQILKEVDVDKNEPESMSWEKLSSLKKDPSLKDKKEADYSRLIEVEKQKRIALPGACLVLGFLALPLGWIFEGMRSYYGAVIVLGVFFVYYALFSVGLGLGETGAIPPILGAWTPNVVFLMAGIWCFHLAVTESGGRLWGWIRQIFCRRATE